MKRKHKSDYNSQITTGLQIETPALKVVNAQHSLQVVSMDSQQVDMMYFERKMS